MCELCDHQHYHRLTTKATNHNTKQILHQTNRYDNTVRRQRATGKAMGVGNRTFEATKRTFQIDLGIEEYENKVEVQTFGTPVEWQCQHNLACRKQ